eukprot:593331-Pelagomonas_calceolata.AAC.4
MATYFAAQALVSRGLLCKTQVVQEQQYRKLCGLQVSLAATETLAGVVVATETLAGVVAATETLAGVVAATETLAGVVAATKTLAGVVIATETLAGIVFATEILAGIGAFIQPRACPTLDASIGLYAILKVTLPMHTMCKI